MLCGLQKAIAFAILIGLFITIIEAALISSSDEMAWSLYNFSFVFGEELTPP